MVSNNNTLVLTPSLIISYIRDITSCVQHITDTQNPIIKCYMNDTQHFGNYTLMITDVISDIITDITT